MAFLMIAAFEIENAPDDAVRVENLLLCCVGECGETRGVPVGLTHSRRTVAIEQESCMRGLCGREPR